MKSIHIEVNSKELVCYICGRGRPLILIHGYLADSTIWGYFKDQLAKKYCVIMVDLPGHGKSEISADVSTMGHLAEAVYGVIYKLKLEEVILLGHSMGGYVALAVREKFPGVVSALVLLNSHPWEDNEQRKMIRDKEMELILAGKKEMLIRLNLINSVAKSNRERLKKVITDLEEIALSQPDKGIISMLKGMKLRTDQSDLLTDSSIPVLIITGEEDGKIDHLKIRDTFSNQMNCSVEIIPDTGHLSFIESPAEVLVFIDRFITQP